MHNLQCRCYIIMIPFGLPQPDIFFSVMSESTWSEVLSDSQRRHLRQFLPQFPENNVGEQEKTISDLFNDRNFNFGNPLHLAQKLFRGASQHWPSQSYLTEIIYCKCMRFSEFWLSPSRRWVLPPGGCQIPTTVCQVPEEATVVLPSAVLPQTGEADSCL